MTDAFWVFMGIFVVQIAGIVIAVLNGRKAKADRTEIKAQVCEVAAHLDTIRTDKASVQLMITGAERENISKGIAIGKRQSDFGPLRTDTIDITRSSR